MGHNELGDTLYARGDLQARGGTRRPGGGCRGCGASVCASGRAGATPVKRARSHPPAHPQCSLVQAAFKHYLRTRDYCTTGRHIIHMCLQGACAGWSGGRGRERCWLRARIRRPQRRRCRLELPSRNGGAWRARGLGPQHRLHPPSPSPSHPACCPPVQWCAAPLSWPTTCTCPTMCRRQRPRPRRRWGGSRQAAAATGVVWLVLRARYLSRPLPLPNPGASTFRPTTRCTQGDAVVLSQLACASGLYCLEQGQYKAAALKFTEARPGRWSLCSLCGELAAGRSSSSRHTRSPASPPISLPPAPPPLPTAALVRAGVGRAGHFVQ